MNFAFAEDGLTAHVRDHQRLRDGSILAAIDFLRANENIWTHRFNPTDAVQRAAVAEELASRTGLDQTTLAHDLHRFEQEITATYEDGFEEPDWPVRGEIPELPSAPALPAELVPKALRGWLVDVATRTCFPLEFVAVPAIVGAGAVVGRDMGIMPGRYDDFLVVPNLWGGIVAQPGLMKTFAVEEGMKPVSWLAATARERYKKALVAVTARHVRLNAQLEAVKAQIVMDAKKGSGKGEELEQDYARIKQEIADAAVTERRYITHDSTVETFDRLLNENPRGLLILRDELAGWLRTLDKPGREGDREFYLEAWNGTGSFTRDRIGRGTIHIDAVTLSLVGGIQPGKLRAYVQDALAGGQNDDGLLQRLQMLVWPEDPGPWLAPQAWSDGAAKSLAYAAFEKLDEIGTLMQPVAESSDRGISYLRFSPGAQDLFDTWRAELEKRLRSKELAGWPAFEAHIAKYRSLMPSLALLFHLLEVADGTPPSAVTVEATALAADWCGFLESHARKVYAAELSPGLNAAKTLASKLTAGAISDGQPIREIARHHWAGLTTPSAVKDGLKVLEGVGWVRIQEGETGGRPTEIVRLHPSLRSGANG